MIKLVIVGYGKMGKEIESVLDTKKFTLTGRYDIENPVQTHLTGKPDVAIEFTTPAAAVDNIKFLASKGINVVCGTTGWYNRMDEVKEAVTKNNTGLIFATNFSVGVNIFFQLVKGASQWLNSFEQYDVSIHEIHHNQKLDRPSGTSIKLAEILLAGITRKTGVNVNGQSERPRKELIELTSSRLGNIFGNHLVTIDSPSDTIKFEHSAKSRRGFAEGALLAAKFIHQLKGIFKFEEIFTNLI